MSALGAAAAQATSGVGRADQLARKGLSKAERRKEVKKNDRDVDGDEVTVAPEAIEGAQATRAVGDDDQDKTRDQHAPPSYGADGKPGGPDRTSLDLEA